MVDIRTISPQSLAEKRHDDAHLELIDVRTPLEFEEVHVAYAKNLPLDQLKPHELIETRRETESNPLYVICRSGARGKQACEKLVKAGFADVVNVEGGTLACEQAGLPLVRGRKVMSLERQVRIAAGSLVLLGVLLGWQLHPGWFGLSAFVGAGLIFAGVTDTCGMGLMLAKMPWNRSSCSS